MKAVGYIRVSTEDQSREGVSLENQIDKIRSYADLHNLELLEVISDAGKSGKNIQREGLQKLIELCKEKQIQHIIIYKLDRLTRKTKDLLFLVEDIFLSNNIAFHSITERLDTTTAQGKFFLTLIGAMAQMERDLISERTKDALEFKKKSGFILGVAPFGFNLKEGKLEENTDERQVVDYIVTLKNQGLTLRKIAQELTDKRIKARSSERWYASSVHYVLKRNIAVG